MLPTLLLPPPGPLPPTNAVTERTAGSSSDHLRQLLLLVAHGGKADVLRGRGLAAEAARVLLREEALGHDDEQIDVENAQSDGDAQHEPLVAQNPAQRRVVFIVQPLEGALAGAIDAPVAALVARFEEPGAEHGRGGERDQQRNGDGHAESVTANSRKSLPTMPPMSRMGMKTAISDVLIESTVKPISLRALHRGVEGLHAHLEIAGDVLDDHDGVVDHEAGGDGERHQREVVDGVAQQVHHAEGAHQRERHGDGRE